MARPNSHRMRQIKRALADRDGAGCFYCGLPFPALIGATVDHLIPQSVLPGWALMNLVLACRPCNDAKADQLPQVFLRTAGRAPVLRRPPCLAAAVAALAAGVARVELRRPSTTPVTAAVR
ncbi:HNH endonuclease [Micromonospora sp. RTGN7]|uniref:HNH endonuclease n=1 Tax=Micromonospora sp. RTGN7 TaxID=3016526 RepID=UPI0029FF47DF|nr:HNH endonuclease [Micromonospora sp. RTGN7]